MLKLIHTCLEAAMASVFLIPIFRYLDRKTLHAPLDSLLYTLFAIYLSAIYAAAGLPNVTYLRFVPRFNFIPFQYMFSDYATSLLNVALFVPLGFFLVLLWKPFRNMGWTVLFGLCLSLAVETLQIFTYRATDINDLMTNTFGCILGYLLGLLSLKFIPGRSRPLRELGLVFSVVLGVMFLLQPLLSHLLWMVLR